MDCEEEVSKGVERELCRFEPVSVCPQAGRAKSSIEEGAGYICSGRVKFQVSQAQKMFKRGVSPFGIN